MAVSDPRCVRLDLGEVVEIVTLDGTILSSAAPSDDAARLVRMVADAREDADLANSVLSDLTKA